MELFPGSDTFRQEMPVKRGDDQRYMQLIWPHRATVLRTAQILCRHDAEADDLAQETLIKAFSSLAQFDESTGSGGARAWLMSILRTVRIDRLRREARHAEQMSLDGAEIDPAAPEETQWTSASHSATEILEALSDRDVIAALGKLPEEMRWALLLVDVEGLDYADAAKVLDVAVGTVKSRLNRGRQMLRSALLPVAKRMRLISDAEPAPAGESS
jgi:RNA polymerase sigma-70 factor, ECF subfamily